MDTSDVLLQILETRRNIEAIHVFPFSFDGGLQARVPDLKESEQRLIKLALSRKGELGGGFWDNFLALCAQNGPPTQRCLSFALYHKPNTQLERIPRANAANKLRNLVRETAVNSRVLLDDGSEQHLPLLDFKIRPSKNATKAVRAAIVALGLQGYLLDSGKSYHFIGSQLIAANTLIDLLTNFTLLSPISDRAWAAHQILERSASLRITPKRGHTPNLIDIIQAIQ